MSLLKMCKAIKNFYNILFPQQIKATTTTAEAVPTPLSSKDSFSDGASAQLLERERAAAVQ